MWLPPNRFDSSETEVAFLGEYCQRFASQRRVALVLGILISIAYLAWDYLYGAGDAEFAPVLGAVMANRVASALLLVPTLAMAMRQRFERDESHATRWLVGMLIVEFAMYCRGFVLAPYPYDYMYFFMGMFICLIFGFSMLRLRSRPTLLAMTILVLMAAATFVWNWQVKQAHLGAPAARIYTWVALSFLISAAMMGVVVCTLLERSERLTFSRANELARLNHSLEERSLQLEHLNEALCISGQQAEERAKALIEMKEQMRQDAERRNREKSQFLAAAVHDLKQPIQAIGNALEPGQRALDHNDVAGARRMIDLAAAATRLMREQLAGVLEMSRLESGFVKADIATFSLAPVLEGAVSQLAGLARRHGVQLLAESRSDPCLLESDRHFVSRIVLNLLSNGIKYSDPGKGSRWVRLRIEPRETHLCIEVSDNGLGIAVEHLDTEAIFKPFFQANNNLRESEKGVGLGLSIVQAMLALLPNHRLTVRSQVGQGTTMTLDVPLASTQASTLVVDPGEWVGPGPLPQARDLAGLYVLYVEDDELVRATTSALFKAYGILYEAAESYAALGELLQRMERVPNVVVTDYRLPEGATAIQVVGATEAAFGKLPVIVVTGETRPAEAFPADWCLLRKPLSSTQLLLALHASALPGGRAALAE